MEKTTHKKMSKAAIDWDLIRRRLESIDLALENEWRPDPEKARQILRDRAEALAREPQLNDAPEEYEEYLEFALAHEKYAIETRHVREVFPLEKLTPLPCTPSFVLGIINIRGDILSVIDIRKFFELPERGLTDLNRVIVIQAKNMAFGILADAIHEVRSIRHSGIQPSLPTHRGIREQYLKGVTAQRTVILDGEKLLTDEKIIIQEQVEG